MLKGLGGKILLLFRRLVAALLEPVVGYTRLVALLKISFVVLALIVMLVLVALPTLRPEHEQLKLTFNTVETPLTKPKMVNPHLQGLDKEGQPYNITAQSATQENERVILLEKPEGDMVLSGGGWVNLAAQSGIGYTDNNTLELSGEVRLFTDEGFEFKTEKAFIDMANSFASGEVPIEGQGPLGLLHANNFRIVDGGNRLLFNGRVKLVIYPKK